MAGLPPERPATNPPCDGAALTLQRRCPDLSVSRRSRQSRLRHIAPFIGPSGSRGSPEGASVGGETRGRCPPSGVRLRESEVESIKPVHAHLRSGTARRLPATRAPVSPGRRSRSKIEPIQWWMYPTLSRMTTGLPVCSSTTTRRCLTPSAASSSQRRRCGRCALERHRRGRRDPAAAAGRRRGRPAPAGHRRYRARSASDREERPRTAILLYTGYGDVARLTDAVDAGISGFLVKDAPLSELIQRSGWCPAAPPTSILPWQPRCSAGWGRAAGLTGDERTLMRMLAED